jgi:protein-disulfide isomerase
MKNRRKPSAVRRFFRSLAVALPILAIGATESPAADLSDKKALDDAIRTYILEHPEVIIEALEKFEAREREEREKATTAALTDRKSDIFNHPMTPMSGNPKGDVTIVEFFDYQCGYCKRTMQTVLDLQKEDPKIRVAWKELPILGPVSQFAARAAMAAEKQGKYLDFHVAVMGARGQLTPESVMKHAADVGLDIEKLKRDMMTPEIGNYLRETLQLAQELGITGTPGFVIGDKLVPGALSKDQLRELIAQAREAG